MHIMPINFNFHNSKIKKNTNNSKPISNITQPYQNFKQIPLEQLKTLNQISFKRNYSTSALTKQNENGKTIVHYATEERIEKIAKDNLEGLKIAVLIQDNEGRTSIHWAGANEIKAYANYIPDELEKGMTIQDNQGKTPVHQANANKIEAYGQYAPKGLKSSNYSRP